MDKLTHYRQAITTLIQRHARLIPHGDDIERQTIFDTQHDHYQLLNVGWHSLQRIHHCTIHLDIKNNQIWIQHNTTENYLDNELIELGVAPQDIIIAFHHPQPSSPC